MRLSDEPTGVGHKDKNYWLMVTSSIPCLIPKGD